MVDRVEGYLMPLSSSKGEINVNLIAAWRNPDHNDGRGQSDRRTTGEDESSFPVLEKDKRAR